MTPPPTPTPELFKQLREDFAATCGEGSLLETVYRVLTRPGFHALAVHRFGACIRSCRPWARLPLEALYRLAFVFVRNFYGIEIPAETKIGRRLHIGHQGGIVLHAEIGDDCTIRHNVTLGGKLRHKGERTTGEWERPVLGSRIQVGVGAVIVGPVTVGDGAIIGANAVVTTDVPAGATVVAQPAVIRPAMEGPGPVGE